METIGESRRAVPVTGEGSGPSPAKKSCPHCGAELRMWRVPPGTNWTAEFLLVCFNDACTYYLDGWRWMSENYGQRASYRYMWDPETGTSSMIPVWSGSATRDLLVDEAVEGER